MAGSLAIPNTFVGNSPELISKLDQNFDVVESYINLREVTTGLLAARPAAGNKGALYVATDVFGGTLYYDNGVGWVQISAGVLQSAVGGYRFTGLKAAPNVATPLTKYDVLGADVATLRNPADGSIVTRTNIGAFTNDAGLAGAPSTANGRDQVAAFTASTWVYEYLIWNGANFATVSSAVPPPVGPTLPAGYTHWGLIVPLRWNGASNFVPTIVTGNYASIVPVTVRSYAVGTGAEQNYDISGNVPPDHSGVDLALISNVGSLQSEVRVAASGQVALSTQDSSNTIAVSHQGRVPLVAQTVFFFGNVSVASAIRLKGYWIPNS